MHLRRTSQTLIAAIVAGAIGGGLLVAPAPVRAAATIHVPGDYSTIQAAIDAAVAGDTVLVGPGTYIERPVISEKDIVVESSGGADVTTIDGSSGGTTVRINAAPGETPEFRGFTVTNGYSGSDAGGIGVSGAAAVIEDNIIVKNLGCLGGGIAAGASMATIRGNTISDNGQPCSGGMGAGVLIGGVGTVQLLDNRITGNEGTGVEMLAAGEPTIDANIVSGNTGVGMALGNLSDATISNNLILKNGGGGISFLVPMGTRGPIIINNTLVGNTSAGNGSAIFANGFDADSQIVNNIIVASSSQSAVECPLDYDPAPPIVTHNDVFNTVGPEYGGACGATGVDGNVSVDPKFVDPSNGNYHLRADSPLIDAGRDAGAPAKDVDGDSRPVDGDGDGTAVVDPGFDESTDPILVDPLSLDFGKAGLGISDTPAMVAVTNFGGVPVSVTSVTIDGPDAGDFAITAETCTNSPLPTGSGCSVTVGFEPTALGSRSGSLTIAGPSPVGTHSIPLAGVGAPPPSGISWGSTRKAGPAYTWNSGNGLARTVSSSGQKLHVAYATDRIGSKWATNSGPYMGIYYIRSTSGSTWTTPKRLNSSKQHAWRMGMTAAGSRVYVAWVSQTRVTSFKPSAPRVLYVRVNTNHGASSAWRSTVRLTSTSGRVDFPTVAASGNDVYVAYTDSNTGAIRLALSHDRGVTWAKKTIGTTTASSSLGAIGYPYVAVSGANVVVAWAADGSGAVAARRSADRGSSWSGVEAVTDASTGVVSAAARGSRVAVAWSTGTDIHARVADGGTWGPDRLVAGIGADGQYAYSPAVVLQGSSRLAVAWAEQLQGSSGWARLNWTESIDDGADWFETQVLASTASSSHRSNDWPSVLWPSEATRQVLWSGWTAGTNNYRLYFRAGTGTPIGPATVAAGATGPAIEQPIMTATGAGEHGAGPSVDRKGASR